MTDILFSWSSSEHPTSAAMGAPVGAAGAIADRKASWLPIICGAEKLGPVDVSDPAHWPGAAQSQPRFKLIGGGLDGNSSVGSIKKGVGENKDR